MGGWEGLAGSFALIGLIGLIGLSGEERKTGHRSEGGSEGVEYDGTPEGSEEEVAWWDLGLGSGLGTGTVGKEVKGMGMGALGGRGVSRRLWGGGWGSEVWVVG